MKKSIYVTSQDKRRLEDLLAEAAFSEPRQQGDLKSLADELRRAVIVEPNEVPVDVITMNSRAGLVDLDTGETVTFTLVFPQDAYLEEDKISVLAPIGAGMLGYRVGDEFEWNVPGRITSNEGDKGLLSARSSRRSEDARRFHRWKAAALRRLCLIRTTHAWGDRSLRWPKRIRACPGIYPVANSRSSSSGARI